MITIPVQPSYSMKEVMFYLSQAAGRKVSRSTVYRWIERGELEVCGIPFFRKVTYQSLTKKLSQLSQL